MPKIICYLRLFFQVKISGRFKVDAFCLLSVNKCKIKITCSSSERKKYSNKCISWIVKKFLLVNNVQKFQWIRASSDILQALGSFEPYSMGMDLVAYASLLPFKGFSHNGILVPTYICAKCPIW